MLYTPHPIAVEIEQKKSASDRPSRRIPKRPTKRLEVHHDPYSVAEAAPGKPADVE